MTSALLVLSSKVSYNKFFQKTASSLPLAHFVKESWESFFLESFYQNDIERCGSRKVRKFEVKTIETTYYL